MVMREGDLQGGEERRMYYNDINLFRDELAVNFGGGIPKKSMMLAVGEDGAGKSILMQRLAYGYLQNSTSVAYISSELNTISFVEQMESMDYDIKYNLLDGSLVFVPMFPVMGTTKLQSDFINRLINTKTIFKQEVVIFDTLSFLMIRDSMEQGECYDLISFFKRLTTIGNTIIFAVDPNHLNSTMLSLLRSVCDIYMNLEISTFAGNIIRMINIIRYKRPEGDFQPKIPFKIETGKGLAVEIASMA